MGPLTVNRQALAMPQALVAAEIHQALDVHRDVAAKITFYLIITINGFTNPEHLVIGQLTDAALTGDPDLIANFGGLCAADTENVSQPDLDAFLRRYIHASNTRHADTPVNSLRRITAERGQSPRIRSRELYESIANSQSIPTDLRN